MSQLTPSANIVALYEAINGQAPGYAIYKYDLGGYTNGTTQAANYLSQIGLTDAATTLTQVFANLGLAITAPAGASAAVVAQAGLYTTMVSIINTPANNITLAYGVNWLVNALATIPSTDANYPNYSAAQLTLNTNVTNGLSYSATPTNESPEAVASLATVVVAAGNTFLLTTGVDTLTGTSSNDTFTADNTGASKTLNAADTINGVAGTDTLKVYLATGDTTTGGNLGNITNVQNLYINHTGATAALSQDFSKSTFTSITVDGEATGPAVVTLKGQSLTLENTAFGATITDTTDTSLTAILSAVSAATLTTTGATNVATINLISSGTITGGNGATTAISLANDVADTTLNIYGATALALQVAAANLASITTITDTGTGGSTVDLSLAVNNSALKFTGGSGGDTLILDAGGIGALTAGSQLNGGGTASAPATIRINDTGTFTAAGEYTPLSATTGFQILGLGGAAPVVDMSQITSAMKNHVATETAGSSYTINNLADSSTVDINGLAATTVTLNSAVGTHTETFNLNTSSKAVGATMTALSASGLTTINLVSNGDGTVANNLGTLTNSDNTTFNVTGSNGLTLSLSTGTSTGDSVNASAFTGALTLTDSKYNDIVKAGSGTTTILQQVASTTGLNVTFAASHTNVGTLAVSESDIGATPGQITVTNFVLGQDVLDYNAAGTATALTAETTTANVFGGATISSGMLAANSDASGAAFITRAEASTAGTAHASVAEVIGSNTWVAEFAAGAANSAVITELVGVGATTLSTVSGSSAMTFTLTTNVDNFTGGAGNDTFNGTYSDGFTGSGDNTFSIGDTLNGGGGTNTLNIAPYLANTAITLADANFIDITNMQDLVFATTGSGAQTITTGANFTAAFATGVNLTTTSAAGAITLNMGAYNGATTIKANSTGGAQTITVGNGADNITATATVGAVTVTVGSGTDSITVNASTGVPVINAGSGVDTINLGTHPAAATIAFAGASFGGGAAAVTTSAVALAAGDVIQGTAGFQVATPDIIKVSGVTNIGGGASLGGVLLNSWSVTADGAFVDTATNLGGTAPTASAVSALIGNITIAANAVGFVAINVAASGNVWDLFAVKDASGTPQSGTAPLGATDTISLVGTIHANGALAATNFTG